MKQCIPGLLSEGLGTKLSVSFSFCYQSIPYAIVIDKKDSQLFAGGSLLPTTQFHIMVQNMWLESITSWETLVVKILQIKNYIKNKNACC